ncbi:polyprenol reductase [Cydia pomonella]|uniref:polyprenol reductase n=1 Tax=Cydia pomonella TaxID=82600 RepID=UPI002ADDB255|nr:polyprenol reductase [Cydia pomonella]
MLNTLDFIFLNLAFMVTCTGYLINNYETYVPAFIIQGFKYGSFAYQGNGAIFIQAIEIPKSYYRHFYSFSSVLSALTLVYMYLIYFLDFSVNKYVVIFLNKILEQNEPTVSATAALIAMSLLTIQCARRFYETHYLQIFAKNSKMNLSHYLAGIIHYFACIIAGVGEAPLFCGNQNRNTMIWTDARTKYLSIPCILIFLWAWYEQYQSNVIFANLRKDKKSGQVVTEDHGIPHGRRFELVSSPHRMCEVIMYTALLLLVPTKTYFCIYLWVLGNQIQTAIQANEWYKATFKTYPKNRKAIFPYVF